MLTTPVFLLLSLKYNRSSNTLFSDSEVTVVEESHIIPIYDCYYTDAPQGKRGDEYCHYYIRNYASKDVSSGKRSFVEMIDPKLKVCCRNGEIFYSDSKNKFFQRFEGVLKLCNASSDCSTEIIGTLEEMNITM